LFQLVKVFSALLPGALGLTLGSVMTSVSRLSIGFSETRDSQKRTAFSRDGFFLSSSKNPIFSSVVLLTECTQPPSF